MVSKHGSTLGMDWKNVLVMHVCRFYMFFLYTHGSVHCYSGVSM